MDFKNAIALTGGIATGKSSVCSILKLYGYAIIDADVITRDILDKKSQDIAKLFGEKYVNDDKIDRKKLGDLIFANKDERQKLENLIHPIIRETIKKEAEKKEKFGVPYLIEIPLFFDRGGYEWIEKNILVYTSRLTQFDRLMKRSNISEEKAKNIISAQMDIEEKKKLADFIIDNSKDLKHLQYEVQRAIDEYIKV